MATRTVGPNSQYPTIAAAMMAAGPNDLIQLEAGYSNETATVTHNGITVFGGITSTGIVLQLGAGISAFTLTGNAPINVLDSVLGQNIVGNAGNNVITVTNGADAVNGGLGHDRLVVDYRLATGAVTGDSTSNFAEAGGSRLVTITSGTFEDFTIRTGSGADTITTYGGDDYVNTGSGAGTVTAGQGSNTIIGGNDADTITALDGGNYIDGGNGTNHVTSGDGSDIILSGTGADTLVTGGGGDITTALGGADTLNSGAGEDRLILNYAAMTTNVTGGITGGNFGTGYTGHVADLAASQIDFSGTEHFTITTGSGADNIRTGDGADIVSGGAGIDTIFAGGGNDRLNGGIGADNLYGGFGADMHVGGDGPGIDLARYGDQNYGDLSIRLDNSALNVGLAAVGDTYIGIEGIAGGLGNDVIVGDGLANSLSGQDGNDQLYGQSGDDVLLGQSGNDLLAGGVGRDEMTGGTGADQFVFGYVSDSGITSTTRDVVKDFVHGTDELHLANIDPVPGGSNEAFIFDAAKGTAAGAVLTGHVGWYWEDNAGTASDRTIVTMNTDADATLESTIQLNGLINLTAGDFVL